MDWLSNTQDRTQTLTSVKNGFEVVRQKPPKPTQRVSKLARQRKSGRRAGGEEDEEETEEAEAKAAGCEITDLDLASFPALSAQENEESRRARVQAYRDTSEILRDMYTAFREDFDSEVFEKLWHEFVALQNPAELAAPSGGAAGAGQGPRPGAYGLPAAVLSARGIGSEADNDGMYPRLVKYLQGRKVYTALLHARELSEGVGSALHGMLQQFMGPGAQDWGANDIQALHAWYVDQTGGPATAQPPAAPAAVPEAPSGQPDARAGADTSRKQGAEEDEKDKRQLRQRKAPGAAGKGKPAGAQAPFADLFAAQKRDNRTRPLVLLIQAAEQVDLGVLRTLIKMLLQDHSQLPVCLLLGSSVPADILSSTFTVDISSQLCLQPFLMPSQDQRLQAFFHDVVLGVPSGVLPLVLSGPPMQLLLERFRMTDGSVEAVARALDLAAMEHCRTTPLAALAAAALAGADAREVAAAAAQLPQDVVAAAALAAVASGGGGAVKAAAAAAPAPAAAAASRRRGAGRGRAPPAADPDDEVSGPVSRQVQTVAQAVADAAAAWASWRLGLLWTRKVAEATGAAERSEFQLPALYAAAASPSFLQGAATDARRSLGHQIIARITGVSSSHSVRSMSSQEDEAGLKNLLDELLELGRDAAEAWPSASSISQAVQGLQRVLDHELNPEQQDAEAPSPTQQGMVVDSTGADGPAQQCNDRGLGLLSPVRQALQGVSIKSPNVAAPPLAGPAPGGVDKPAQKFLLTAAAKKGARAAAMLQAAQVAGAKQQQQQQPAAAAAAAAVRKPKSFQDRAADALEAGLRQLLGSCPFVLPGSCAFVYRRTWELEGMLTFAPRAAAHEALLRPHTFLLGPEQEFGVDMEDAAIAYRLLLGQDVVDVGRWFEEFVAAAGGAGAEGMGGGEEGKGEEGEEEEGRGRGRGRRNARGRTKGRRQSPEREERPRGGRQAPAAVALCPRADSEALSEEQLQAQALTLAARFSQAVAELQFIGICRPGKRRKQATMQRTYYPPESLL